MDKQTIYVDDELLKCDNLSLCCTKDCDNTFFTNNYSMIDNEEIHKADFKSIQEHDRNLNQQLELKNLMIEIFADLYRDLLFYATKNKSNTIILEPENYINIVEDYAQKFLFGELKADDVVNFNEKYTKKVNRND